MFESHHRAEQFSFQFSWFKQLSLFLNNSLTFEYPLFSQLSFSHSHYMISFCTEPWIHIHINITRASLKSRSQTQSYCLQHTEPIKLKSRKKHFVHFRAQQHFSQHLFTTFYFIFSSFQNQNKCKKNIYNIAISWLYVRLTLT